MEVNILDINDNPPVFQRKVYDVTLSEASNQGQYPDLSLVNTFKKRDYYLPKSLSNANTLFPNTLNTEHLLRE